MVHWHGCLLICWIGSDCHPDRRVCPSFVVGRETGVGLQHVWRRSDKAKVFGGQSSQIGNLDMKSLQILYGI